MNDSLDEFESALSQLRPAGVPAELVARVAAELDRRAPKRNLADRCLMTFIGGGALAASVIVCLIGWQVLEDHHPTPASPPVAASASPSIAAYQQALARSNEPMIELIR
jgi:hypothetical protein